MLYDAARHPTKTVQGARDVLEGWYDGLTKEERQQRGLRDARKQVLYLRQRNVSKREILSLMDSQLIRCRQRH